MREKWHVLKCVSPVLTHNQRIWNLHGSLTLNNGKLIWYFRSHWHTIVPSITNFFILFGMGEKMAYFEPCVLPVLMQNQHSLNFHGSLTLNNGKVIRYFRNAWHAIVPAEYQAGGMQQYKGNYVLNGCLQYSSMHYLECWIAKGIVFNSKWG